MVQNVVAEPLGLAYGACQPWTPALTLTVTSCVILDKPLDFTKISFLIHICLSGDEASVTSDMYDIEYYLGNRASHSFP